jgi:hypothetical protein
VEWNKENRKAVKLLDEFLRSQAAWKLVQPNMEWRDRDLTTTKEERKVKKRIKESQGHFKLYFDKKRWPHNIKVGDWVRVSKKRFKHGFFHNDQKTTLNSKYSRPAKVLKVVKGTTTL